MNLWARKCCVVYCKANTALGAQRRILNHEKYLWWKYLEAVNYFPQKTASYLFDRILITRLVSCIFSCIVNKIITWRYRSRGSQMVLTLGALKNFANFTGKTHVLVSLLRKLQDLRPANLLKRDSSTGIFLWNWQYFQELFFYRTPPVAHF